MIYRVLGYVLRRVCHVPFLSPQQALITAASEPAASVILSCLIFQMSFVGLQVVGILMVILAIVMPAVDLGKVFGERQ